MGASLEPLGPQQRICEIDKERHGHGTAEYVVDKQWALLKDGRSQRHKGWRGQRSPVRRQAGSHPACIAPCDEAGGGGPSDRVATGADRQPASTRRIVVEPRI